MQILRSTPATIELQVYVAGTLSDLDANPTLTVTDANGTAVAGIGVVSHPAVGIYRATVPGQANLTWLKAVWNGLLATQPVVFTRRYEIVGNLLFLEAEARGKTITGLQTPLADEAAYPDSDIARIRKLISDQFEQRTSQSWIRRYDRAEIVGTGRSVVDLRDGYHRASDGAQVGGAGRYRDVARIIAATSNGDIVDPATLVIAGTLVHRTIGTWSRGTSSDPLNVVVEYEYGPDPVPLEANENGLRMALANLVPSDISGYAQTYASEDGTISFGPNAFAWPTRVFEWLKYHKPVNVG